MCPAFSVFGPSWPEGLGQASLRETTLEDVFVERAGRHLMPS